MRNYLRVNEAITTKQGHGNVVAHYYSDWKTHIGYIVQLMNGEQIKVLFEDIESSAKESYLPARIAYLREKYENLKKESKKEYEYIFNLIINDLKEL